MKATDGGSTTTVTWTAPTVTPGTSPIVGYTVRAVSQLAGTGGGQDEVGKRISDPKATTATLPTALAGKTVEVRSYTVAGESWPPAVANKTHDRHADRHHDPDRVGRAARWQLHRSGRQRHADRQRAGHHRLHPRRLGPADLGRRQPGRAVLLRAVHHRHKDANGAAVASVTLRYVAFDSSGNPSLAHTEIYKFGAAAAAGAPTAVKAVPATPPRT